MDSDEPEGAMEADLTAFYWGPRERVSQTGVLLQHGVSQHFGEGVSL